MLEHERRRAPRYPFSATAEILDLKVDSRTRSQVRDLSQGGCYIETPDPLPPGTNVIIEIYTDTEFLETHATVAFDEPNQGMGLAFSVMQPYFASVLAKWLAQVETGDYTH